LTGFQGPAVASGDNTYGQLGDGTNEAHHTPVLISALGKTVTQVAAGAGFGVALKADGTVWTWGLNEQGQLGDGTVSNKQVPQQVPNLPAITQISTGIGHVLALASDGTVWAWGANDKGQVGEPRSHVTPQGVRVEQGHPSLRWQQLQPSRRPERHRPRWADNHCRQSGSGDEFESGLTGSSCRGDGHQGAGQSQLEGA